MNRVMTLSIVGALLAGVAPGCVPADGVDADTDLPRSAGLEQASLDGRLTAPAQVRQEALDVDLALAGSYEDLVAAKPQAAPGQPFHIEEERGSTKVFDEVMASDAFRLSLDLPKSDFVLGEPVILRATLTNVTDAPQQVAPLLDTIFDRFEVTVTTPEGPRAYRSMVQACTLPTLSVRTLQPGETFTNDLRLVAPKGGWMFRLPGDYTVEATLKGMTDAGARVIADPVELTVLAGSAEDQAIAQLIMDSQAALLLDWRDSDDLARGQATLEQIVTEHPDSIHALYAAHVLGNIWANDYHRAQSVRAADPMKAISYLAPAFRRLVEPGAPVVAWDVAAGVTELLAHSQVAVGRGDAARATLKQFIGAYSADPFQAPAVAHARELLSSL